MFNDYFTRLLLDHCQEVSGSGSVDDSTMNEIHLVAKFISSNENKYLLESKILRDGVEYLTQEFSLALNAIDSSFYSLNQVEREKIVKSLWQVDCEADKALSKVLINFSYQEIVRNIQVLLEVTFGSPFILVQTPIGLSKDGKDEVSKKIQMNNDSPVIVQFQVNKNLIGGMRVFENGKVKDLSWMGRIEKIVKLNI